MSRTPQAGGGHHECYPQRLIVKFDGGDLPMLCPTCRRIVGYMPDGWAHVENPPRPEREVKAEALAVPLDLLRASARFWTKVNVSSSDSACWTWAATLDKRGYGRVSFRDRPSVPAHRIAWAIFHGRLPDADKYICHRCDNPPCVNPHHLFEADPATNFEDMLDKGRGTFRRGFCRKGHALTGGNVILRKDGNRRCRTCANEAQSAYYARSASDSACEKCGKVMRARNLGRHMRLHADADRIERGDA